MTTEFGRRGAAGATARGAAPARAPAVAPDRAPRRPSAPGGGAFAKLFSLQGRTSRMHYWLGQTAFVVMIRLWTMSIKALGDDFDRARIDHSMTGGQTAMTVILLLALLAVGPMIFWASFALVVRRWHDRGKSAAWAALGFIPLVGWTWQGVECGFMEGTLGPNLYGPSPKGIAGVTYEDDSVAAVF